MNACALWARASTLSSRPPADSAPARGSRDDASCSSTRVGVAPHERGSFAEALRKPRARAPAPQDQRRALQEAMTRGSEMDLATHADREGVETPRRWHHVTKNLIGGSYSTMVFLKVDIRTRVWSCVACSDSLFLLAPTPQLVLAQGRTCISYPTGGGARAQKQPEAAAARRRGAPAAAQLWNSKGTYQPASTSDPDRGPSSSWHG